MSARASAWQPLPEELPSEVRHFVELLRRLKDRTGLSLVGLGERASYSKSSWQRYLNARQPPPGCSRPGTSRRGCGRAAGRRPRRDRSGRRPR
ncbi:hypothetical protein GCM10010245_46550 [Streptomyces spectabilis]|uniref:XRE family transcriptional regulator n=1 Tax=Streptomyces spectabilis TaxID=68270 RepID=A0A7W8EZ26_STRST|nr:hypothetical protein [Streptomyces spectabilis]GGV28395.1 hypothetical protein GCM10010245_46550 [Streptomyces spectabilis]